MVNAYKIIQDAGIMHMMNERNERLMRLGRQVKRIKTADIIMARIDNALSDITYIQEVL